MRILIYILLAVCLVGCCAALEPGDVNPPHDPERPVQPIKRRPITPDGIVWRPRYTFSDFEFSLTITRAAACSTQSMSVEVYSLTTGETFRGVLRYEGDSLTIPRDLLGEEFTVTTECDGEVQVEVCTVGQE